MNKKITKIEMVNDKRSGLATAGMVLGIIAIVGCWIPFLNIFSIIMGFVGVALALPAFIMYLVKKKGSLGKSLAGLVLCVIAIIVGISMNNSAVNIIQENIESNTTEEILKNDVDVSFSEYIIDSGGYLESGKVEVTVSNKSSETHSFWVFIEALDSEGNRIDTSVMYANNLAANQSSKEDKFYSLGGSIDKFKDATFRVYDVSKY